MNYIYRLPSTQQHTKLFFKGVGGWFAATSHACFTLEDRDDLNEDKENTLETPGVNTKARSGRLLTCLDTGPTLIWVGCSFRADYWIQLLLNLSVYLHLSPSPAFPAPVTIQPHSTATCGAEINQPKATSQPGPTPQSWPLDLPDPPTGRHLQGGHIKALGPLHGTQLKLWKH